MSGGVYVWYDGDGFFLINFLPLLMFYTLHSFAYFLPLKWFYSQLAFL